MVQVVSVDALLSCPLPVSQKFLLELADTIVTHQLHDFVNPYQHIGAIYRNPCLHAFPHQLQRLAHASQRFDLPPLDQRQLCKACGQCPLIK